MVKWLLVILLHFRKVPGSKIDLEIGYPETAASFPVQWGADIHILA
jgi:hypothetical protein